MYRTFYRYKFLNVAKHFQMSITDLLALPREYVELIFKICQEEEQSQLKAYTNIQEEIEQKKRK